MIVRVVRTPPDLERTLEADLCRVNHWAEGPARHESALIERILARAFSEPGGRARGTSVDPLRAIAEPLRRLAERGLQLVAVVTRGCCRLPSRATPLREVPFEMTDYLVAPDPCYFRPAGAAFEAPIHTLGSQCAVGHATLVCGAGGGQRLKAFRVWASRESVTCDFERSVPWCGACGPQRRPFRLS